MVARWEGVGLGDKGERIKRYKLITNSHRDVQCSTGNTLRLAIVTPGSKEGRGNVLSNIVITMFGASGVQKYQGKTM